MTREEIAKFLHVSRPHVDKLIDQGDLPFLLDIRNGQRRVPREAAEAYKMTMKERQRQGLEQMYEATAELGLYNDEIEEARAKLRKVGASDPHS